MTRIKGEKVHHAVGLVIQLVFLLASTYAEDGEVSMIFGGDVDFSRLTRYLHHKRNCSYENPLKGLETSFETADFSLINLETTVGRPKNEMLKRGATITALWSEPEAIPPLKKVGVTHVGLANNHVQDFTEPGLNRTIDRVKSAGIGFTGIVKGVSGYLPQEPLILEKNGLKIGVLSYCHVKGCRENWQNMTIGPALMRNDLTNVISDVKSLRKEVDVVVLFLHWQIEYSGVNNFQAVAIVKKLTQSVRIDLITGSHPHVTQKHWYVGNTLVVPSLGNLFFSPFNYANIWFNAGLKKKASSLERISKIWYKQMMVMRDGTSEGRILRVTFNKKGVVRSRTEYINTRITATSQHCMVTEVDGNSRWREVCGKDDDECTGTSTCNYVMCDDDEPTPNDLSTEPPAKIDN